MENITQQVSRKLPQGEYLNVCMWVTDMLARALRDSWEALVKILAIDSREHRKMCFLSLVELSPSSFIADHPGQG